MNLLASLQRRFFPRAADPIRQYIDGGRLPFSTGYGPYRWSVIEQTLGADTAMACFREHKPLPTGYGQFLDERVVEFPWLLSRLPASGGLLLDAGSALNHPSLLDHGALKSWKKFIVTLAPEKICFWEQGVSYIYADLRDLLFRDNYLDTVVCISTLEHIGMDNTFLYTRTATFKEHAPMDYLRVVKELHRVLKPGGTCYITVPFGQYQDDGFQQQFDAAMLEDVKAAFAPATVAEYFFKYSVNGWNTATRAECASCEYFNVHRTRYFDPSSCLDYDADKAAAARSVAALEMVK